MSATQNENRSHIKIDASNSTERNKKHQDGYFDRVAERTTKYLLVEPEIISKSIEHSEVLLGAQLSNVARLDQRATNVIMFASAILAFSVPAAIASLMQNQYAPLGYALSTHVCFNVIGVAFLFLTLKPTKRYGAPGMSPSTWDLTDIKSDKNHKAIDIYQAMLAAFYSVKCERNQSYLKSRQQRSFVGISINAASPILSLIIYLISAYGFVPIIHQTNNPEDAISKLLPSCFSLSHHDDEDYYRLSSAQCVISPADE